MHDRGRVSARSGILRDDIVAIADTVARELPDIVAMERGRAFEGLIAPYAPERHQRELADPAVCYQTIRLADDSLAGFAILRLDDDGESVELRRIVVARPGQGTGRRALGLIERLCRERFGRRRIWLDVFAHNERARHVYSACGYRYVGQSTYEGLPVELYEKAITETQSAQLDGGSGTGG